MQKEKAKQKKKNQHYVPCFHLKRFTYDGLQLYSFDKIDRRKFTAGIDDVATQRFFYDIPGIPNIDAQVIEDLLAIRESDFAGAVAELLDEVENKGTFTPGPTERQSGKAHDGFRGDGSSWPVERLSCQKSRVSLLMIDIGLRRGQGTDRW